MILDQFCNIHQVSKADLLKRGRCNKMSLLRQVFAFILFNEGKHPRDIAKILERDRTTIIYCIKKVNEFLDIKDKEVIELIKRTEEGRNDII